MATRKRLPASPHTVCEGLAKRERTRRQTDTDTSTGKVGVWFLTNGSTVTRNRDVWPCRARKDGLFRNNVKCSAHESHFVQRPLWQATEFRAKHRLASCDSVYPSHTELQAVAICKQSLADGLAGHRGICSYSFHLNDTLFSWSQFNLSTCVLGAGSRKVSFPFMFCAAVSEI